ncbi:MAG: DNA topoisomerase I [Lachnospiraceae bacterium]|nr:DNA topoisomerase I [Lachnospiraceae bacterium]
MNGQQINIPEKLKVLRIKSQRNELFCPCGCGANLILVAGDKNLREQHFRIKDGSSNLDCKVIMEGKISVDSKIVLKCWLDDKIGAADIESRVAIHAVDDINRKYEFTFLSKEKKIALSYCRDRVNLSEEKLTILEDNSKGIHIIYVVDSSNGGSCGQYPEGLMKIQDRQGYCLLLTLGEESYNDAELDTVFYAQDIDDLWKEMTVASGNLKGFAITPNGEVLFNGSDIAVSVAEARREFEQNLEMEKARRIVLEKQRVEHEKEALAEERRLQEEREKLFLEVENERRRQHEEIVKRRREIEEKHRLEEEKRQEDIRRREEDFKHNMEANFLQQETQVRDGEGNRWIKCDYCGKIAKENEFVSYGGKGHINLGICKECSANNPAVKDRMETQTKEIKKKYDPYV